MVNVIEIVLLGFIIWLLMSQRGGMLPEKFTFSRTQRKLILDSCALIDGRIVQIVEAGFMIDELVIPQFILNELQLLADGNDAHKRERARFGLDIAHQLQDSAPMKITIDRTVFAEIQAIDDKLIALAKKLHAQLYTTDFNLGKVAAVEGVRVLNVNELSQGLRPIALPGETLDIKIVQKGSNRDQGVGYLDDGTMIVVDGGARFVGTTMPVVVTRMHQTVAGKMVFGQVRETPATKQAQAKSSAKTQDTPDSTHAGPPRSQNAAPSASAKLHARLSSAKPSKHGGAQPARARKLIS